MIIEKTLRGCECDGCGDVFTVKGEAWFELSKEQMKEIIEDEGWKIIKNGQTLCCDCINKKCDSRNY